MKKIFSMLFCIALASTSIGLIVYLPSRSTALRQASVQSQEIKTLRVGWLDIMDSISKFEQIITPLMAFEDDSAIDAIIIRIDSPGGTVGDSCIIADYIRNLSTEKPVIAFISNVGASGAYVIAASCSYVICSPGASVGSIGVVSSHVFEKDKAYISITSGQFKHPKINQNYQASPAYLKTQQVYIDQLAETFIDEIVKYRDLPRKLIVDLQAQLLSSTKALEYKLVDQVGTLADLYDKTIELVHNKNNTSYQELVIINTQNKIIKSYSI